MKALKLLLLAFVLALGSGAQAQAPDSDLANFLVKFKIFELRHYPKAEPNMPMRKSERNSSSVPMPNAIKKHQSFTLDPVTRLQHYPLIGRLYDPETGFSIPFDPKADYRIDVKAGKIYKGETEVKPEKHGSPAEKA